MPLPPRGKRKQSRASFFISAAIHVGLGMILFLVAAREGILGTRLREITAVIVPKEEKPPEPKKPKEEPKEEPPKQAEIKPVATPVVAPATVQAAPPPNGPPTAAAPPPVIGGDFDFSDGAKVVQSTSDPRELYKQAIEFAFRSRWKKPEGKDDSALLVEVEVSLDSSGTVLGSEWKRGSGDAQWDKAVRTAVAATTTVGRKPPAGFPARFLVRFDAVADTEPVQ